jgi:hypothetical protein
MPKLSYLFWLTLAVKALALDGRVDCSIISNLVSKPRAMTASRNRLLLAMPNLEMLSPEDGRAIPSFQPEVEFEYPEDISSVSVQDDGTILLTGRFLGSRAGSAEIVINYMWLKSNGEIDHSKPLSILRDVVGGSRAPLYVKGLACPDGNFLVYGPFQEADGHTVGSVIKFGTDGRVIDSFRVPAEIELSEIGVGDGVIVAVGLKYINILDLYSGALIRRFPSIPETGILSNIYNNQYVSVARDAGNRPTLYKNSIDTGIAEPLPIPMPQLGVDFLHFDNQGRLYFAAGYEVPKGKHPFYLYRLGKSGSFDPGWEPVIANGRIENFASSGDFAIITGRFGEVNGVQSPYLAKITLDAGKSDGGIINISSRARVDPFNPLIAGFIIDGIEQRSVIVRATSPTLQLFGVLNTLPGVKFSIYRGEKLIANASEVADDNQQYEVARAVGLFPIQPSCNEAVGIFQLPPGSYTVVVEPSTSSTFGVALVEVYGLP